jgi:flavorubredoxin
VLYTGTLFDFIICKNKVTVRETAKPLTGDFDTYNDCLLVAKEKVAEYIRLIEPEQISMFA